MKVNIIMLEIKIEKNDGTKVKLIFKKGNLR